MSPSAGQTRRCQAHRRSQGSSAFLSAKIDKIIDLKPDCVFGFSDLQADIAAELVRRGVQVTIFNQRSVGEIFGMLYQVAAMVGEVERGEHQYIGYFEQEVKTENQNKCIEEVWNEFPHLSQGEVRAALARCGLTRKHIESKISVLSGGEKAKVRMCKLMNRESNVLVFDEPTNHLDVDAKDDLKRALKAYKGSIILISHEPEFYQEIATDIWNCESWTTKAL